MPEKGARDLAQEKTAAAAKAMESRQEETFSKNAPFESINTESEGHIVGEITSTKFEFENEGDQIVGFLRSRQVINMPDQPVLYEIENGEGDWAFFGSRMLNDRLELVSDGVIVDITFTEWKPSKTTGRKYKNYAVKFYEVPLAFDHEKFRVMLDQASGRIDFYEATDSRIIGNLPVKD